MSSNNVPFTESAEIEPDASAIDVERFFECFNTIEKSWAQINNDLMILDPQAARCVEALIATVLRVGRTYQADSLRKLR
ncbi:Uncharacterised protein [Serratia fonticola]|nr:Uncharacterised protein [Serratia fonticola]